MVAVGITVGMLLMIGTVFKSATDASGSAMALNDVNGQARVLTEQIQSDFAGFQKDLPFAIIFEAHVSNPDLDTKPWLGDPDEPDKLVRYDRICFFANGDFQDIYGSALSGNLARIFYGQMLNSPYLDIDNDVSPPRQILARRRKIMTAAPGAPTPKMWSGSAEQYDSVPFEQASANFWKNELVGSYGNYYFNQAEVVSFVRPPDYDAIQNAISMGTVGAEALQQLYFLSDVTDFKIQLYLEDTSSQGRWRWYPDDQDMIGPSGDLIGPVAFYCNTPDLDPASDLPFRIYDVDWFCDKDQVLKNFLNLGDLWPKAIRFTFTLYDKNRRRFGEGQTFSYIVKIPPRY